MQRSPSSTFVAVFRDADHSRSFVDRLRRERLYDHAAWVHGTSVPDVIVKLEQANVPTHEAREALQHVSAELHSDRPAMLLHGPARTHQIMAIADDFGLVACASPPESTCEHRASQFGESHPTPIPYSARPYQDYCPDCDHLNLIPYP